MPDGKSGVPSQSAAASIARRRTEPHEEPAESDEEAGEPDGESSQPPNATASEKSS